jgi:broad specificity phosphatase PhoE
MADVVLVRHAETAWSGRRYCGRSDPPLSRAGRLAASRVAAGLVQALSPSARIVSSPSRRARETAASIAAAAGIEPVEIDERWREVDFGIAEGLTFDALASREPDLAQSLADGAVDIDWPGGERAEAFASRISAAWRELVDAEREAVVVSHAGPLRFAIALATGVPAAAVELPATGAVIRLPAIARV